MNIPNNDFILDLQDALNRGQITNEQYDEELKKHAEYLSNLIN